MPSSSIPVLKSNLQALLAARPNLANVQISYGAPLPDPSREFIWIADVHGTEDWMAMAVKQEDYSLDVVINVTVEGPDQQAATERCFVLRDEIETVLLADTSVNGAVMTAKLGGAVDLVELVSNDGLTRGADLTVRVVVMNRIS